MLSRWLIEGTMAGLVTGLIVLGCTKKPDDAPAHVIAYDLFDCAQLAEHARRVSIAAADLAGVQDSKRADDLIARRDGIVIYWPSAFMVSGEGAQAAELARLKGEFEAIQQAAMQKNCSIRFEAQ